VPTAPRSIQSAPQLRSLTRQIAPAALPYADDLAHGSCSSWFQKRLATITAVVAAILAPVLILAGGRHVDDSSEAPRRRASPAAGRELGRSPASFLRITGAKLGQGLNLTKFPLDRARRSPLSVGALDHLLTHL
jgi:hypothetical protein